MAYLQKADYTRRSVVNPLGLMPGGETGTIVYTRAAKNMISSPTLIRRFGLVAAAMKANCSQPDHCTRNVKLVGKLAPDGKPYRSCGVDEASSRLKQARSCAMTTLPTV